MQLPIEACIGIAKQAIKAKGKQVPSDARQAFNKLAAPGLDESNADWKRIVDMRNALAHDYLNLDPERVMAVVKSNQYQVLIEFAVKTLKRF